MSEIEFNGWEKIRQLGEGGQSTVFLVRSRMRAARLQLAPLRVGQLVSGIPNPQELLKYISEYIRPDTPDELGALKIFDKVRRTGAAPDERIRREMDILRAGHANLPQFIDGDLHGKWMVTEYFPGGTLENFPERFKGDALGALNALRPLVETVAHLHNHSIVHRDIKPANIFIGTHGQLIAGDFGIAYRIDDAERMTVTHERVGPWQYMPQWGDTGERLEEVKPSFDLYMLGKLLWCMISGRLRLPREYHRRPEYDLSKIFPHDRKMNAVNPILDRCIVEHESDCLQTANELLGLIDETLSVAERGLIINEKGEIALPCLICGKGIYIEETSGGRVELTRVSNRHERESPIFVRVFCCNVCTHRAFFAPGFPDEAHRRKKVKL